jgi:starch synthase
MYSLRYGTTIVRKTGGLKDTVIDFGDNGNELVMINLLETSAILSKGQSTCKDKEHLMQRIQE